MWVKKTQIFKSTFLLSFIQSTTQFETVAESTNRDSNNKIHKIKNIIRLNNSEIHSEIVRERARKQKDMEKRMGGHHGANSKEIEDVTKNTKLIAESKSTREEQESVANKKIIREENRAIPEIGQTWEHYDKVRYSF